MKKLKVLLSVLLSAMLVLSLVVPSMAESEYIITINKQDVQAGEIYTAYKIFDLQYTTNAGQVTGGIYTATEAQKDWIVANIPAHVTFEKNEDDSYKTDVTGKNFYVTGVDAEPLAKELNKLLDDDKETFENLFGESNSATFSGDTCTIDVGSAGYFFVTTTSGSVCSLDSTTPKVTIKDKNQKVTVDKIILGEGDVDEGNKGNDAQIGDTVNFKTTVTIPANSKSVVLHDKMDPGFTFSGSVTVTVSGGDITSDDYVFTQNPDTEDCDSCTFDISFNKAYLDSLEDTAIIEVSYSAVLNENATIIDEGTNDNTTWVRYGENQTTQPVTTETRTTYFNLFKYYGAEKTALPGAEFELYRGNVDDGKKVAFVKDGDNYRVASTAEIDDESVAKEYKIVSIDKAIKISGLDADYTYNLKETKAPDGYNALQKPVEVKSGQMGIEAATVEVENKQGSILPATGGTGTKVLFTVGGIMMVVAFVLITSKRRMEAEK